MERVFAGIGSLFALLAVALGAFGAHGLRGRITPSNLDVFETAVRYHLYHALALFVVAWVASRWPGDATNAAGWLFVWGIVVFSGSLYILAISGQRWLGAITPLGGLCLLAGWGVLAWRIFKG